MKKYYPRILVVIRQIVVKVEKVISVCNIVSIDCSEDIGNAPEKVYKVAIEASNL